MDYFQYFWGEGNYYFYCLFVFVNLIFARAFLSFLAMCLDQIERLKSEYC